jgi:DNA-3-methyladenine glycosylase I
MPRAVRRCFWAESDPLLAAYHDAEWGVPIHDDRHWYEKLLLDGAQAGLSWLTILRKREGYRAAFRGFDPAAVARFTERDVTRLMGDPGIVRNRLKIRSAIANARAFLKIQAEHGSFDAWIWGFVGGQPIRGNVRGRGDIQARTPLSDALSKELRGRGFDDRLRLHAGERARQRSHGELLPPLGGDGAQAGGIAAARARDAGQAEGGNAGQPHRTGVRRSERTRAMKRPAPRGRPVPDRVTSRRPGAAALRARQRSSLARSSVIGTPAV